MSWLQIGWVVRMNKVTTQITPEFLTQKSCTSPAVFVSPLVMSSAAASGLIALLQGEAQPFQGQLLGGNPVGCAALGVKPLGFDAVPARFSIVDGSLDSSFL